MTPQQFDAMMSAWGAFYGERRGPDWQDDGHDAGPIGAPAQVHPLERARAFAPGTRRAALARMHLRRGGVERRQAMGAAAGLAILPAEFVDPIPCVETREAIGTPRPDPRYTDSIRAVQEAWLVLREWWPIQAEIVRLHYQVRGFTQREKAQLATMAQSNGDVIGLKRFKDELRLGRTWLHARLSR